MEWESDSPCCSHMYPGQECWSPGRRSGWVLEFRDCGAIPGWGLLLTAERLTEGMWGRRLWGETPVQESQAAMTAESREAGGAITIASTGSWTTERLAHQTPEALNYRVGPRPGGPLYVPDALNNRKGPQAREPSKCLNGRSYRKRLAEEASGHQLQEAQKETLMGP